jgi:hypothetical protein
MRISAAVDSFASIPATVERLLTGRAGGIELDGLPERFDRVGLVLLDAFGWEFAARHVEHRLIKRLRERGRVAKLFSQFPTTTTAHVTTIHTGLPVGEHGLYEWNVYEPSLGAVITPMLFSRAGDTARDTLQGSGLEMRDLLPMETLYQRLARDGVRSIALQPAAFSPSTYDSVALAGAELRPYPDFREGARMLTEALADPAAPAYVYLYWDGIDATGHRDGPGSPAFEEACTAALDALEAALFYAPVAPPAPSTLLLLTADHGLFAVDPAEIDYLEDFLPELPELLEPAMPAGSARDVFLHVRPGKAEQVARELGQRLNGRAAVHLTADLVERGLFGEVGPRLRERLGDVCVLPAPGRMAWLRSAAGVERTFRGHHGGLTAPEVETWVGAMALA